MPMYEYFCPDCNQRFEKLVRKVTPENAEGGIACPTCARTDTRRVLSVFAAVSVGGEQRTTFASGGSSCGCDPSCGCGMNRN